MDFKNLARVEYSDQRILLTEQLADFYGCKVQQIQQNFVKNKDRFTVGKHYFKLEGTELKTFKSYFDRIELPINKFAPTLYLWTKRGAARHAKMLSTDKAWEVFEELEDTYFESKEKTESLPKNETHVAVQNQPFEMKLIIAPALKDVEAAVEIAEKLFSVKHGIALATCINAAEKNHNVDFSAFEKLIPPAEHEIGRYTPTQLAKKFGLKSAQAVNQILLEKGLQEKDDNGGYILTEKGAEYAEAMPYERNGHTGYQIKWTPEVVEFFK